MEKSINVFGEPLQECGRNPVTGFFRDGYCNTGPSDSGAHTLAAIVSSRWLKFSAQRGNDLRPILSEGCRWCLCVSRWKEALEAHRRGELPKEGVPRVVLPATHQKALGTVSIDDLRAFSAQPEHQTGGANPPSGAPIR